MLSGRRPAGADAGLVIRARRAWVGGAFRPAAVAVRDGVIDTVLPWLPGDAELTDSGLTDSGRDVTVPDDAVLLPGLVDTHVHVNEPGRTEWEGFASATRAAALGGVTTLIDMPLNSVPATTSAAALAEKRACAAGRVAVDVGFWGGAVPNSLGSLVEMWTEEVFGFKCFLAPSGVEEFPHLSPGQLRAALAEVAALGAPLIVHAEDPAHLHGDGPLGRRYADFVATRPPAAERAAVARVIDGVRATGARAHILHLSDAGALPLLRAAKDEGLPVTAETCPHYLTLDAGQVPDGATEFKCCPPIRDAANQDGLWAGLLDGTIDLVVSDHSPSTVSRKRAGDGDWGLAWGGIAGLQVGFRAVWTEAARRGIGLEAILPAFTTGPAALAGLIGRGVIAPGAAAHFAVVAPDAVDTVRASALAHRNPITAFDGLRARGRILETWLHGERVASYAGGVTAVAGRLVCRR